MLSPSSSLRAFTSSPSTFRILHTFPSLPSPHPNPKTLYILDSSFNPPTLAHMRMCLSALQDDSKAAGGKGGGGEGWRRRLLLLLATQNADKPPKPAAFEQRLAMMGLMAEEIHATLQNQRGESQTGRDLVPIDVAVTKTPLFIDKVSAIAESGAYGAEMEQTHLIGFDTLVKLMDVKYYPPEHTLKPLEGLFERHRVRVRKRDEEEEEGVQEGYVKNLADGGREQAGGRREWAERIEMVEGNKEGEEVISSTRAREAAGKGDKAQLESLVLKCVAEWIEKEGLYKCES